MNSKFKIILIGGCSGSGKSYLAKELGKKLELPVLEIDDIRISMQQIASKNEYPKLFTFLDNPDYLNTMRDLEFVENLLTVNKIVWQALKDIISKHEFLNEDIIIEGDGLIPELVFQEFGNNKNIKCIFLDVSREIIKQNKSERNRHGKEIENLEKEVEFSKAYNDEIIKQAGKYNMTVLRVQNRENMLAEIIKQI